VPEAPGGGKTRNLIAAFDMPETRVKQRGEKVDESDTF
jgi:hypothetical protein